MKQQTLAMANGFERYAKKTRRAEFLEEMEQVVPWAELVALIEPHYPKAGNGRPPVGVERMLRIYFLQQWFNLSDPAVEEALYDSAVMREFVGIDLGREPVPDETTVCKFRHLLEEHKLGGEMLSDGERAFAATGACASRPGRSSMRPSFMRRVRPRTGSRSATRRCTRRKKGKQWYFGMKAHMGVDSKTKLIHAVVATAANVADATCCRSCCTAKRRRCGATRRIAGRER